jgi:hypothetical protein
MKAWQRAPAIQLLLLAALGCSSRAAMGGGDVPDSASSTARTDRPVRSIASSQPVGLSTAATAEHAFISDPFATIAAQPQVSAPQMLGLLVGPRKDAEPRGVQFFGTDMGLTVEHRGQLYMLFGDTWATGESVCEPALLNDDIIGILPSHYDGGMPSLQLLTETDSKRALRRTSVYRGSQSLPMGYGRAAIAGFSDGERSYAIVQRLEPTRCEPAAAAGADACATGDGFSCAEHLGVCEPAAYPLTSLCDATLDPKSSANGCVPDQTCVKTDLCVDLTSSQYTDGSFQARQGSVAYTTEIAAARSDDPSTYDSVLSWPTNKFAMPNTRSIARFTGTQDGNDYSPGYDTLLYWGRSGHLAENGRESQLYLMTHRLPLPIDAAGKLAFEPRFFAGVDANGEPQWSALQSQAKPIALDGQVDGSPHELLQVVGMYTISWLGAPINKWVMLYGGDLADYLLLNPSDSRASWAQGAIYLRFADHPWGPFSPPVPHLLAGDPKQPHAGNGPGGFLFHPECVDTPELRCARSDTHRPPDVALDCQVQILDPGRLYQPNIIDDYTQPNAGGGLDIVWNVSTWNPYGVQLVKTSLYPSNHDPVEPTFEPGDRLGLERMSSWASLPDFGFPRKYVQQSSADRGLGGDLRLPLSGRGNRDYNNFVCVGRDAQYGDAALADFRFDQATCEEQYVRGAVMARFEGSGYLARTFLSAQSLEYGPADDEVLRIYVDDDPRPVVDVPLAEALDGRAGEIFAPPFGAGSPLHLSWYYPIAFRHKLIVALDGLGRNDLYYHQSDAVLDPLTVLEPVATARLPERDLAARQLSERYQPAGLHGPLHEPVSITLESGATQTALVDGPATIHEFRVRFAEADLQRMASVRARIRWDGAVLPAIDVPLLDLLGGSPPPEQTSLSITSYVEGNDRVLALKLPMPFDQQAELSFSNTGRMPASFELRVSGDRGLRIAQHGKLHVQPNETVWPAQQLAHHAVWVQGRGKLVGVCAQVEGHAQAGSGAQYDHLNFLEGDVHANIDGAQALDGTGTEAYADDSFYYLDAPHATAFAQVWGVVDGVQPPARASFCRWHVLGTELDFQRSMELTFELGGQMNPWIVDRYRTLAYLYLED